MKISILRKSDFLEVQGTTEPYYLIHFLKAKNHEINILGENSFGFFSDLTTFCISILDFLHSLKTLKCTELIYSYKGHFMLSFFGKFILGKKLVYDLRVPPVGQVIELSKLEGSFDWKKKLLTSLAKKIYKMILPQADLVVVVSEGVKEIVKEMYGVPREKIHIVPLGVDLEKFNPKKFKETSFTSQHTSIVCVSSIERMKGRAKGIKTVLDGLKILKGKGFQVSLSIIGSIPENIMRNLKTYARKKKVSQSLHFKGYIPHEKIPTILTRFDIAISPLPDLRSYEVASPSKVFEYLAMKKIVIASDVKSNTRVINHGYNGLIYNSEYPLDFALKVENVITNPNYREKIRKNTRKSIRTHNWENMLSELEKKLLKLIKKEN